MGRGDARGAELRGRRVGRGPAVRAARVPYGGASAARDGTRAAPPLGPCPPA